MKFRKYVNKSRPEVHTSWQCERSLCLYAN